MNMNRGMNQVSDSVAIQDKTNPGKAGKWTKSGVITDYLGFKNYEIKIDGSNHLSTRHRSHLRKIVPYINTQMQADQTPSPYGYSVPVTRSHTTVPDTRPATEKPGEGISWTQLDPNSEIKRL